MKFLIVLDLYIIFLIAFFTVRKKSHIFVNIFTYFVLEFLITSYFSIINLNIGAVEISGDIRTLLLFRAYELIIEPLICIWYLDFISNEKSIIYKCGLTIFVFVIFFVKEFQFVQWGILTFISWEYWKTLVSLFGILFIAYILQIWFKIMLRKEGINS